MSLFLVAIKQTDAKATVQQLPRHEQLRSKWTVMFQIDNNRYDNNESDNNKNANSSNDDKSDS